MASDPAAAAQKKDEVKEVPSSITEALIRSVWPSEDPPANFTQLLIRIVWFSRFRELYLAFMLAAGFSVALLWPYVTELIVKPFFTEKIRVLRYDSQLRSSLSLMDSADPGRKIAGVSLLQELAISYPHKRQEMVKRLSQFLRDLFPQAKGSDPRYIPVLEHGLRVITTIPRQDDNGHPLHIDLHQMRVEGALEPLLDLTNMNFKGVTLWGCQFHNVILAKSNFENADLGGVWFVNSSLEFANLKGAKINYSFIDQRVTTFEHTRLFGTNLEESELARGKVTLHPGERWDDFQKLAPLRESGKIIADDR